MPITNTAARGQKALVCSIRLPVEVRGDKQKLLDAGVIFGAQCEGDKLFCAATLPPGWTRQPTDHLRWSKLVDADGVERASMFYKAASYDRAAFLFVTE